MVPRRLASACHRCNARSRFAGKTVPVRFTYKPSLSTVARLRYGERSHRLGLASHTNRPLDRFGTIAHFQLAVDAAQVVSNGLGTDPASGRDLASRLSLANQGEDAAFGPGKSHLRQIGRAHV